jgi:3-oxoacyl-[acyl-carrier-protein] synthase III
MADDKTRRGQPDRSKINMSEGYQVQYWTKHLGISHEKLQQLIDKVGNSAAAVRKELATT